MLQQFLQAIAEMKAKANATLAAMPPIEQYEATQELAWTFRSLQNQANTLIEFANNLESKLPKLAEDLTNAASAEAKKTLVESKEFIAKADHETALTAAANTRETEVRNAIAAEKKSESEISARRATVVAEKLLPAVAAEKLPVEVLKDEATFRASCALVKERLAKLEPHGITAESAPSVVAGIAELTLDEAGNTAFEQRLKFASEAAGAQKKKVGGGAINPLAGAGASAAAAAETTSTTATAGTVRRNLL